MRHACSATCTSTMPLATRRQRAALARDAEPPNNLSGETGSAGSRRATDRPLLKVPHPRRRLGHAARIRPRVLREQLLLRQDARRLGAGHADVPLVPAARGRGRRLQARDQGRGTRVRTGSLAERLGPCRGPPGTSCSTGYGTGVRHRGTAPGYGTGVRHEVTCRALGGTGASLQEELIAYSQKWTPKFVRVNNQVVAAHIVSEMPLAGDFFSVYELDQPLPPSASPIAPAGGSGSRGLGLSEEVTMTRAETRPEHTHARTRTHARARAHAHTCAGDADRDGDGRRHVQRLVHAGTAGRRGDCARARRRNGDGGIAVDRASLRRGVRARQGTDNRG
jgi:hypothetical protein